jgi:hypothetical protein
MPCVPPSTFPLSLLPLLIEPIQLSINPADSKNCESYIKCSSQGQIFSDYENISYELDTIFNLNIQTIQRNCKVALDVINF